MTTMRTVIPRLAVIPFVILCFWVAISLKPWHAIAFTIAGVIVLYWYFTRFIPSQAEDPLEGQ